MSQTPSKQMRVLAVSPSSGGFGFCVLEDSEKLVDWGIKSVTGDKNAQSVVKIAELISHYEPGAIVLEDNEDSARSARMLALTRRIVTFGKKRGLHVALLPGRKVRQVFFEDGKGTKHALATILAERFPEELGTRLPPKRRAWTSEDYRMDIFDAVALCLAHRHIQPRGKRASEEVVQEHVSTKGHSE